MLMVSRHIVDNVMHLRTAGLKDSLSQLLKVQPALNKYRGSPKGARFILWGTGTPLQSFTTTDIRGDI